jgi:hypothetical protein
MSSEKIIGFTALDSGEIKQIRGFDQLYVVLCEAGKSDGEALFMNYFDAVGAIAIAAATDYVKGGHRVGGYEELYDKYRAAASAIRIRYPEIYRRSFVGAESKDAIALLIFGYAFQVQLGAQQFVFGRTG